jgi:hypothetical protein
VKALEIEKVPLVYLVEAERRVYSGTGRVPFLGPQPADKGRGGALLGIRGGDFPGHCHATVK